MNPYIGDPDICSTSAYVVFFLTLDLRSGSRKSQTVPPPRPYRKKVREMVIHSPKNFPVRPVDGPDGTVPPSVAAAGAAASTAATAGTAGAAAASSSTPVADDLLHHDFDAWDSVNPTGTRAREVPAKEVLQVNAQIENNNDRDTLTGDRERKEEEDRISVAGSATGSAAHPPLNPFTPEWFERVISVAATAAATAVASSSSRTTPPLPSSMPRRLNDRKVPDFWEDRPEFWFRIFDAHLSHFNPGEQRCFDALLPLLTPAARSVVHSIISAPDRAPYSRARESLLRHFGRTPRQNAREAREARVLGDRLPTCLLYTSDAADE